MNENFWAGSPKISRTSTTTPRACQMKISSTGPRKTTHTQDPSEWFESCRSKRQPASYVAQRLGCSFVAGGVRLHEGSVLAPGGCRVPGGAVVVVARAGSSSIIIIVAAAAAPQPDRRTLWLRLLLLLLFCGTTTTRHYALLGVCLLLRDDDSSSSSEVRTGSEACPRFRSETNHTNGPLVVAAD